MQHVEFLEYGNGNSYRSCGKYNAKEESLFDNIDFLIKKFVGKYPRDNKACKERNDNSENCYDD